MKRCSPFKAPAQVFSLLWSHLLTDTSGLSIPRPLQIQLFQSWTLVSLTLQTCFISSQKPWSYPASLPSSVLQATSQISLKLLPPSVHTASTLVQDTLPSCTWIPTILTYLVSNCFSCRHLPPPKCIFHLAARIFLFLEWKTIIEKLSLICGI